MFTQTWRRRLFGTAVRLRLRLLPDPLTGRSSPVVFGVRAHWHRRSGKAVLAVLDLDRFVLVNDQHGFVVGDGVLATVAHLLSMRYPQRGALWRVRDRFYVTIVGVDRTSDGVAAMQQTVEEIRRHFAGLPLTGLGGRHRTVTASAGVAPLSSSRSLQDAVRAAQEALYDAKCAGGGKVCPTAP